MTETPEPLYERYRETTGNALNVLTVGTTFRMYKKPHPRHAVGHVRAVIDDEYIVYRVWSSGKQIWIYRIEWAYYFGLLLKDGSLVIL